MSAPDTTEVPIAEGEIPSDGIVSLLTELESLRATGALVFEVDGDAWEVSLVAGQIATEQPERDDAEDAVEKLLSLRAGSYRVYQRLPPLLVSSGDASHREGSLAVHVPADLMNYCERAGLSGELIFESSGMRAEILYDGGELSTIRLDGVDDLNDVFAWEDGSFHVDAKAPAATTAEQESDHPEPARVDTEPPLLSVVEVALASIVREREERRPGSRTGPPLPPMPQPMTGDTLPPPKRRERRDATVKVIYLGGAPAARAITDTSTRHVRDDVTAEDALPEATRGRAPTKKTRPEQNAASPQAVQTQAEAVMTADQTIPDEMLHVHKPEDDFSPGKTLLWVIVVLSISLAVLALLAQLPALE
ncbi:MAG: DUF4388 domain-containing protein [Deltaproteobacteria bacterium]|nr:DUF4388 domain-containing protein [Deltaproteobacteria bacterium]